MIKLSSIKPNPNNPRIIKDGRFKKLVESIKTFPKMMSLRPLIVDENGFIIGGNMRYKALQSLGYTEIQDDWVKKTKDLSEEEKKQFLIRDNINSGEWEWESLANEWDVQDLTDWGIDLPTFETPEQKEISNKPDNDYKFFLIKCPVERVDDVRNGVKDLDFCEITESNG